MFNTHICKNCFETYSGKPEVCPNCGAQLRAPKVQKEERKKVKKEKKKRLSSQEIAESIDFVELLKYSNSANNKTEKEQKRAKNNTPEFTVDKNGEFNVNIKDVTYLPNTYEYSVKKARGEYDKPQIKWWEIYKWADLMIARKKVKKQVQKASHYRPEPIKKKTSIALCVFFGWMGAHNFYARNYRKAWFTLIAVLLGSVVVLAPVPFFEKIRISIGGGLLFVVLCMWLWDLINLIFNKFAYRLSRWRFIDNLNTETRAILGDKYIDKNEYKKPWIVRVINKINAKIKKAQEQKLKEKASIVVDQSLASEPVEVKQDNVEQPAEKAVKDNTTEKKETEQKEYKPKKKAKVVVKNKR